MESLAITPDKAILPLVLKACARLKAVERGRRIHSNIRDKGMIEDVRVGTALVDFYCKCGLIDDARELFDQMGVRDVVLWNALVHGYVECCFFKEAILLYAQMQQEGLKPNSRTFVALLLACKELLELRLGQEVHSYSLRNGLLCSDPHLGTALIGFYSRFDVKFSQSVFDLMVLRNTVSWNAMITGYVDAEYHFKAWQLFLSMLLDGVKFDSVTLLAVIQACAELGFPQLGIQLHQMAIKFGYSSRLFVVNALLNLYSQNGSLESSSKLFKTVTTWDVALWNSMIGAYIDYGFYEKAVNTFMDMRKEGIRENERTIAIMLTSCEYLADAERKGQSLHAHKIKSGLAMDVALGNAFLSMYSDLNCVEAAQKIFTEVIGPDVISWNTLISAFTCSKLKYKAWDLFVKMQEFEMKPNSHTIVSLLAACDDDSCLNDGKAIHGFALKYGIEIDSTLNTALTVMYMDCGDEATARILFEECPNRDLISWNALIASYVRTNHFDEAWLLFSRMILEVEPNCVTIINILSSYNHFAALPQGQCLHGYITRRPVSFDFSLSLANSFLSMYVRCGSMQNAEKIFKLLHRRNIISWNALITGYGSNGRGYDAILAFVNMLEDGLQPNGATLIALLSACRHSGLIEEGLQLFQTMVQDFNITPELVHYGCVVDLLCRGGHLNEAREFIESMAIEPDASMWRALLSACRIHSNTTLAVYTFDKLIELEPMNAGNYVLLSNIYAAAGLWLEVRMLRTWLQQKGLRKPPGTSWIVVRNQVHCFTAGDISHPQADMIYASLCSLAAVVKENAYSPDSKWFSQDEED